MLSMQQFLLILVSLICREVSWWGSPGVNVQPLLSAGAYCLGFGLLAKLICLRHLRRAILEDTRAAYCNAADHWHEDRQKIESVWVMGLPAVLLLTGWGPWIAHLEQQGFPQSLAIILWFVPSLAHLFALEVIASQFEIYLRECEVERLPCTVSQSIDPFFSVLSTRLRLGGASGVLTCLLPVLLIAASADLLSSFDFGWNAWQKSVTAALLGLSCVAIFLPQVLSRCMGVKRMPASVLRDRIEGYCKNVGVRVEIMWVASDGRWSGAAVVGWLPGHRQLWLGDALIEQLDDDEVDMVVMHELAHLKRRHFLWRLLPVLTACFVGLSIVGLLTPLLEYSRIVIPVELTAQGIGMGVACLVMLFGLSKWSRHCELDADRQACLLGARSCPWTCGDTSQAAESLARALTKLHPRSEVEDKSTWLHPALGHRLAGLRVAFSA
jgi:Zn-dependent protease with chaperone function